LVPGVLLAVFVLQWCALSATDWKTDDWPTMGRDAAHTSYFPGKLDGRKFAVSPSWSKTVGGNASQVVTGEVATGDTRVFAVGQITSGPGSVIAYDIATGVQRWKSNFVFNAFSCSPPTYSGGLLFMERCNGSDDTWMWSLFASDGSSYWNAAQLQLAQWDTYYAPLVVGNALYCNGGTNGGLYGRNISTPSQVFLNTTLGDFDAWTPAYSGGFLYTWVGGYFRCHNPNTGAVAWSLNLGPNPASGSMATVPVISGNMAYVIRQLGVADTQPQELDAINLTTHQVAWRQAGNFTGSPAVANGVVYALCQQTVVAYNATTGAQVGCYSTGRSENLTWQPIVTDDALFAASNSKTFVFRQGVGEPFQVLPTGGIISLARGRLLVSKTNGTLDCYATETNSPPVAVTDSITVNAGQQVNFDPRLNDFDPEDPTHPLTLSVTGVTTPTVGQAAAGAGNTITYTAPAGLDHAYDRFTYTVRDAGGQESTGMVLVKIGTPTGDWWTVGKAPTHTSYVPETTGNQNYQLAWSKSGTQAFRQAMVADGRVFAVDEANDVNPSVSAFDLKTGGLLWNRSFLQSGTFRTSPPSYDNGRVVLVRCNNSADTNVWSLDAATGVPQWAKGILANLDEFGAPCLANGGVWASGGTSGGIYGIEAVRGTLRFWLGLDDDDRWSAAYYEDKVYTWVGGFLGCLQPLTGAVVWSLDLGVDTSMGNLAIRDGVAYLVWDGAATNSLKGINISTRATVLNVSSTGFTGSPAVSADHVYVIDDKNVKAYTLTGTLAQTYLTGSASALLYQPIVLDDQLIVSSSTQTFIFTLGTTSPTQTIEHGGHLSYANG
jgi:hypothetical protein